MDQVLCTTRVAWMWSSVDIVPAKRSGRELFVRLFLALAVAVAALSVGTPGGRSAAVINGSPPDAAPPWVAALRRVTVRCSGALIAPNLVLTAKHCDPSNARIITVGRADAAHEGEGEVAAVDGVVEHPTEDLAIHILHRSVSLSPLPIGSDDPSAGNMSFVPFTLYGYGRTNDVAEPEPVVDGKLRTAVGLVSACSTGRTSTPREFCLKSQSIQSPCKGDSGAPLVASGHLLGVYKQFRPAASCLGAEWIATSVGAPDIKKWLNDTMAANPPAP